RGAAGWVVVPQGGGGLCWGSGAGGWARTGPPGPACAAAKPSSSSGTAPRASPPQRAGSSGACTSSSESCARRSTSGSDVRNGVAHSLLDLIGDTPLVELTHFSPKPSVRVYAKLEGQNPTGSIKDRVAKAMLDRADLEPGARVIEPTSGNTGISLALICKLRGYRLTCVMPENATDERKRLLDLYGAEIVYSPGEQGSNGAVRLAQKLADEDPTLFMPFQYANEANPRAHYEGTGAEIAAAL